MSNVIYPGSFDPFTNGHLHVVKNASQLFNHIYLVIAKNSDKTRRINITDMKNAIEETLAENNIHNVTVIIHAGLLADLAKKLDVRYLFKGIRNESDFQYEKNMEKINREMFQLETVYIGAGDTEHISSSMVMELYKYGIDISRLVPESVYKLISNVRRE